MCGALMATEIRAHLISRKYSDGCGDKSSSDKQERKYRTGRVPKKTGDSELTV
jgi:hypothetical protein